MSDRAMELALRKLRGGDKTEAQIRAFLEAEGVPPEDAADTLDCLKGAGYVNDARYCERFIEAEMSKGRGEARILQGLLGRGISGDAARRELGKFTDSENERARAAALTEGLPAAGAADAKALEKTARKLARLGYDAEIIAEVLEKYETDPTP